MKRKNYKQEEDEDLYEDDELLDLEHDTLEDEDEEVIGDDGG